MPSKVNNLSMMSDGSHTINYFLIIKSSAWKTGEIQQNVFTLECLSSISLPGPISLSRPNVSSATVFSGINEHSLYVEWQSMKKVTYIFTQQILGGYSSDANFIIRIITEKITIYNRPDYMCFIDFEKNIKICAIVTR